MESLLPTVNSSFSTSLHSSLPLCKWYAFSVCDLGEVVYTNESINSNMLWLVLFFTFLMQQGEYLVHCFLRVQFSYSELHQHKKVDSKYCRLTNGHSPTSRPIFFLYLMTHLVLHSPALGNALSALTLPIYFTILPLCHCAVLELKPGTT